MEAQLKFVKSNRKGVENYFKTESGELDQIWRYVPFMLNGLLHIKDEVLELVVLISLVLRKIFKLNEVGIYIYIYISYY